MSKRGENIHKRKDGRWEARIRTEATAKKYVSVYGKSYREVRDKKNRLLTSCKLVTTTVNSEKRLADVISQWEETNLVMQKDSTKLKYSFLINQHINPELGELPISKIDSFKITQFFNKKLQEGRLDKSGGLEPSYLKVMVSILKSVIQFAVEQKYCNPIKISFHVPKPPKRELVILDQKDQIRLENEIVKECTLTGLGILLSLNAGLRISEICALRWEDINLSQNYISVRHTISRVPATDDTGTAKTSLVMETPKTYASLRDIPIPLRLVPVLKKMKSSAISEYVVSDRKTFISPRTYEYRFHKLLAAYDIPKINYHALRHTFATRCIEVGIDIKTLSELMGHSNVSITLNTYVHSSMELKRQQIEKLSLISGNNL